jgi:hypothetical protein
VDLSHWRGVAVVNSPIESSLSWSTTLASVLAFHGPHAFALGTAMAIGAVDGGNGLFEQIGRRITSPLFGTWLLFPQLGNLLAKMLDQKIDLAKKSPQWSAFQSRS